MKKRFAFTKSFLHASAGIRYAYRHERNFRIQLGVALATLALGALLHIRRSEWIVLLLLVLLVLLLEIVNTAAEHFLDVLRPRFELQVQTTKDLLSGAVMIASLFAFVIGALIFVPAIVSRITGL
jgi:diacylglycerol kinase